MSFCLSPFTLPGGAPAPKIGGSLPPLPPPPVRRHDARVRRGRASPVPHYALPQRTRGIRANPLPMRVSGHNLDHNSDGSAL